MDRRGVARRVASLSVAVVLMVGGCGRSPDSIVKSESVAPTAPRAEVLDPKAAKDEKDAPARFAFLSNNDAEFWVFARRGVETFSRESGEACAFLTTNGVDATQQKEFIADLVKHDVKGLAICPKDAAAMGVFLAQVNAKVPVLLVDIDVADTKARRGFLGTNNYLSGRAAGELVRKAAPRGGKIAIFVGRMDAASAVERRQGLLDQLAGLDRKTMGQLTPADASDLKVGDYLLVKTLTDKGAKDETERLCEKLLDRSPDVDVLIGLWAYNAPALARVVEKRKIKTAIVAFDEDDGTLQGIQNGTIVGTVIKDPFELGYQSMKLLRDLAAGDARAIEKAAGKHSGAQGSIIELPSRIIGLQNVAGVRARYKEMLEKR